MGRKRGPVRIYRPAGKNVWMAAIYVGDKRRRMSLGTTDEGMAHERLAELLHSPPDAFCALDSYSRLCSKDVVYFLQAGIGGPIKIGRTDQLSVRLKTLQTAHPKKILVLGLLAETPGLERQMHALFDKERLDGEWFRPSPELLRFVSSHTVRPR